MTREPQQQPGSEGPVRPEAVAGMFYPRERDRLATMLDRLMAQAEPADAQAPDHAPKAIIAPHAGYDFSGGLAARAYRRLAPARGTVSRIVLLGPCHRVPVRGLAATSAAAWRTPLGEVPIDRAALDSLADLPQVREHDDAHAREHSLEVHLPFLQKTLGDFALVPFAVGSASAEEVAEVLERLWGGPETRIVISTDLSHFHDYDTARALDGRTAEAIERLDWRAVDTDQACGRVPLSGMLSLAERRGLSVDRVGLCSSGDTAGPRDRVVGYGAWVVD